MTGQVNVEPLDHWCSGRAERGKRYWSGHCALAGDVGDVQPESGALSGQDAGRRRTGPFVKAEDAASGVIWPG
jgi:hypothetical protein